MIKIVKILSPDAIVEVWGVTSDIFEKHKIPLTKQTLKKLVKEEQLTQLLQELNSAVGSSTTTWVLLCTPFVL
jgi:hypothetical protein